MLNPIDYSISKFVTFSTEDTLSQIRSLTKAKLYKKGDTIETRGDKVDHIYLIEDGLVQLGINGVDGSRFNLSRLGPGHTFGETAYFLKNNVMYDANAGSDAIIRKLSGANINHLIATSPIFSKALMAVSAMRVQTTLSHIADTLSLPLEARLAKLILSVSQSIGNKNIILVRQVDFAHSLGVSRVSIGKAIKSLAAKDVIKIGYGKLTILDRPALNSLIKKAERSNLKLYQGS